MKHKVNYIAYWAGNKATNWSGTTLSLLTALKKIVYVNNIDIYIPRFIRGLRKLFHLKLYFQEKKRGKASNKLDYLLYSNEIKRKIKNKKNPSIFISQDFGKMDFGGYIYQDLSMDSELFAKKNYADTVRFIGEMTDEDSNLTWRRQEQLNNYNKLDGIFTMGLWQKKILTEITHIPANKVHHVGGGINIDPARTDYSQKKRNKILFIARDSKRFEWKGGRITLQSFQILKQKLTEAELYILGGYHSEKETMSGLNFIGEVDYEKLCYYYNTCDIFCMPSYFEGYGIVFPEALTFGLPCLGRNRFEMPHFIEHGKTGLLIDEDNPVLVADYMYELLRNPAYTQNVRKKREYYLQEYSWDTVAKRIIDIIFKE